MLVANGISKSFKTGRENNAVLENIHFEILRGEFICILGPSGCGKTTLLRCLGGYESLSSGDIRINGQKVSEPGIDRVMVFQAFDQLFAWKTVEGNIDYPLKMNGFNQNQRRMRVLKYLEIVGLEDYAAYYPHQLSGGMKQRTALARALALEPQVLLMDEPFGAVDAQTRKTLQDELISIWEKLATTILFVTHDIEEAIILADRIFVMSRNPGKIKMIMDNPLPRPRIPGMGGFSALWTRLYDNLGDYFQGDISE